MNLQTQTRSPQFETTASRLAELVHLLADVPFSQALDELPASVDRNEASSDPLWIVAGALVRLRNPGARPRWIPAPAP